MAEVFLETERMFFRKFSPHDAHLLFELDNDPELMRFISKGQPTPLARIENVFLPRVLNYYAESPPRGFWAAHLRARPEFIGWFHLRPDKVTPAEMELGYRLRRSVRAGGMRLSRGEIIRRNSAEFYS
jgi:RimJ/RimL family protein N-acetyltransferase